ncbi:MAG: HWE histidine kinase domain-containing protein [Paracoccaceae bacterium]
MIDAQTDELRSALDRCAEEPIHIPGRIQGCGAMLVFESHTGRVAYVSENIDHVLQKPAHSVLGVTLDELFDPADVNDFNNRLLEAGPRPSRVSAGFKHVGEMIFHVSVSPSENYTVLEFEEDVQSDEAAEHELRRMPTLMNFVQNAASPEELLTYVIQLCAGLSGYDRVMAYRFDAAWNGEVIAEHAAPGLEPYLGLRFPHWDIPSQARAMMLKFPLRFIADVDAEPIPILASSEDLPPLDISLAQLRGVSPIHNEYLRNMGVRSTMTLSILVEDKLWGIISFHHRKPKVPPVNLRQVCAALAPLIGTKLESLSRQEVLNLHHEIGALSQSIAGSGGAQGSFLKEAENAIGAIYKKFEVDGIAIGVGEDVAQVGVVAPDGLLEALHAKATSRPDGVWHSQSLIADLDQSGLDLRTVSGAMMLDRNDGKWICLLRKPMTESVRWAGAPKKDVDTSDGRARLHPRGSFGLYKQIMKDTSKAWQNQDQRLLEGIAQSLIAANQRQVYLAAMHRQQGLVVDELNHRVRNILALVRSVARQARKHNTSLESYSDALEQRINALASAHDLGANQKNGPVSLKQIIEIESAPYTETRDSVVQVAGPDLGLTPEKAPILALVLHELMTNAAKYGALSTDSGHVGIFLSEQPDGAVINWMEMNGPSVQEPQDTGFGTTLITSAIPYEMNGSSELTFHPSGVIAKITLPRDCLADLSALDPIVPRAKPTKGASDIAVLTHHPKPILIVEDNYMIALDLASNLKTLGFHDVEMAANLKQARDLLDSHDISLAILDINLGRGGNSVELTQDLDKKEIPYFFVSGYGELAPLPTALGRKPKLQKPVSVGDLQAVLSSLLTDRQVS